MKENKDLISVNQPTIGNNTDLMIAEIARRLDARVVVREMKVEPTTEFSFGAWGVTFKRTGKSTCREYEIDPRRGGGQK